MKEKYTFETTKLLWYLALAFIIGSVSTFVLLELRGQGLSSSAAQFQRSGVLVSDRFTPPGGTPALGEGDPVAAPPTGTVGRLALIPDLNVYYGSPGSAYNYPLLTGWENAPALPAQPTTPNISYKYVSFVKTPNNNFPVVSDIVNEGWGTFVGNTVPSNAPRNNISNIQEAIESCGNTDCYAKAFLFKLQDIDPHGLHRYKILEILSSSAPSHNFKLKFIDYGLKTIPFKTAYKQTEAVTLTWADIPAGYPASAYSLKITDTDNSNTPNFSQNVNITSLQPFKATYSFSSIPSQYLNKNLYFCATITSSSVVVKRACTVRFGVKP